MLKKGKKEKRTKQSYALVSGCVEGVCPPSASLIANLSLQEIEEH